MTYRIALRDAARIVLPFSLFVAFFSHGAIAAASLGVGAICLWPAITDGLWQKASVAAE